MPYIKNKTILYLPQPMHDRAELTAGRALMTMDMWIRNLIAEKLNMTDAEMVADTAAPLPHLTPMKRQVLSLLQKASPMPLTTTQLVQTTHKAQPYVYIQVRDLLHAGMISQCEVPRTGHVGAPAKAYSITELGTLVLGDKEKRDKAELERWEAMQAAHVASTRAAIRESIAHIPVTERPAPIPTPDETYRPLLKSALYYLAMSALDRSIQSEEDVNAMKARHVTLTTSCDSAVKEGKTTYSALLKEATDKIESLGGRAAISERFNGGSAS